MTGQEGDLSVRIAHERRCVRVVRARLSAKPHSRDGEWVSRPVYRWFTTVRVTLTHAIPHDMEIRSVGAVSDQPSWTLGARDVERAFDPSEGPFR